jgi:CheY-like chemotaxis protein
VRKHRPTILLVDDDPNDLLLLEMAFGSAGLDAAIQVMSGGREAIEYLDGCRKFAGRTADELPNFIITDLKMPAVDGFALLEFLKSTPELALIPTVIFSGSSDKDDITKSYWLGAASYHVKPSDPAVLSSLVKALHSYWLTCELPDLTARGTLQGTTSGFKLGDRFVIPPPHS